MSTIEEFSGAAINPIQGETATPAAPGFDPARYRAEVDAFDITEAQKQELLLTLWSIMRSFVELGFQADVPAMLMAQLEAIPDDEKLG